LEEDSVSQAFKTQYQEHRWVLVLLSSRAISKKARGSAKKNERRRKKREFGLFPPSAAPLETRFQSPIPLGRGKSKGFE
jgi:hypothetical protein